MPTDRRAGLRDVRDFDALLRYLHDEMGWPIGGDDFEELTFDYTPEELGIDAQSAAKIQEIKRLRPLSPNQPWGIFFVTFEPKRLPVVALRRILSSVVLKKRAFANSAERAAWAADDLLFVSNFGEGDARQITFAHFSQDPGKDDLPTLKVLGWDSLDAPLHLDHVADVLTTRLAWPANDKDIASWRDSWRSAFTLRNREVITTSKVLAVRLAELARGIRDRIKTVLAIETENGPVTQLMKAFQEALVHDLDADGFADMYAQTITYGLLSARVTNPTANSADGFAAQLPVTNPFLKDLMTTFLQAGGRSDKAGPDPGVDFDELGVSEVVELLDDANMEAVVRDFGDKNPQEDPVIHFYELFLKEYDAKKRMQRGVFYTPRPVVSYIVRSVHELLQTEFGLADGLADTATWGEMATHNADLTMPEGVKPDDRFVTILDPATGTGTFLVEAIDVIHRTLVEKWRRDGRDEKKILDLWNDYVPEHLLPRLHGYELLMAPYAIAHLKVGLKLHETGYRFESTERVRIYLTNSLEPAHDFSGRFEFAVPALAHEAEAVNQVKRSQRFTVVIGNPPYANYSANLSPQARRIVDKFRGFHGVPIRERNQLQFERNIQDDFVKFIAIGEGLILAATVGILSYITNATMLASTSLRGMREHISHSFGLVYELNLHGGRNEIAAGAEDDENVFEIVQSVAIHAYARLAGRGVTAVAYADMFGQRSKKCAALLLESVPTSRWRRVDPDLENCSFLPQDDSERGDMRRMDWAFSQFGAGIKTNRDAVAIGFDRGSLVEAIRHFEPRLVDGTSSDDHVVALLYRPFDVRYVFYEEVVVSSRSWPTMKHVLAGPNIGLLGSSTWTTPERFSVGISRLMVEMKTGTHDRGTTLFPLYRYEGLLGAMTERVPNLTDEFIKEWSSVTGTRFIEAGQGDLDNTSAPEDVLYWLYGLMHSPEYRRRYRGALAQRFPIVLLTSNKQMLRAITRLGRELAALHLVEAPAQQALSARYDEARAGWRYEIASGHAVPATVSFSGAERSVVGRVKWSDDTVWIDAVERRKAGAGAVVRGTVGFRGVREDVWNFHFGGYQVCEKWLKDRRGRILTAQDIAHYYRIVIALHETIRLMGQIDQTIDMYGGWPAAFQHSRAFGDIEE